MALYAIGDLHLSLAADKPMDVFGPAWENHVERLKAGFCAVGPEDVTVLCGDLSWATSLEESLLDFKFIDALPGKKYVIKGNHDYWFSTAAKIKRFFAENDITSIGLIHNNCAFYNEDIALCGTRGWFFEEERAGNGSHDEKIFRRELMRLETSLKAAGDKRKLCFLHYPPVFDAYWCHEITEMLRDYRVERCCYGHLHGHAILTAALGEVDSVDYRIVSADALQFCPMKILQDAK